MSKHDLTLPRAAALLILLVASGPLGCPKKSTDAEGSSPAAAADEPTEDVDPSKLMSMPEVVFDPRNPPPGFTKCHRNHCHRVGGGVASYAQVMEEIGATKIIGVPKPKPMPTAPSDVAAAPPDAQTTPSGLATKILKPGSGAKPTPERTVVIHYTAWTSAGRGFDSSVSRGKPAMIPLAKLHIQGLAEALLLMSPGEKRRLWVPQDLAFQGRRGKPTGTVVFDVELLEIL